MEFRNLTPFSVMEYAMADKHGERYHVIAMKTGFRIVPDGDGQWRTLLMEYPALPLCLEDKFFGELNTSPVRQESNLAPFKPVCDIIVNGTAYTPNGVAAPETIAGVLIHAPSGEMILDKRLLITGQHFYRQQPITGQWHETEPEPFTSLPLNYHYAFGGECRIEPDSEYADHIPAEYRLTDEQRRVHPEPYNPPLAHTVCPVNPLGLGFIQPWYQQAGKIQQAEAPRIISVEYPFTLHHFIACLDGKADGSAPEFQPAGFGAIGRTWLPRLPLAGTYDREWLENRHPGLPEDFNFRYWNAAPHDQQIPFPAPGTRFVLSGLHPEGDISFTLPASRAGILLRMDSGECIPQMMWTDTLLIDTDALTIEQTWRYLLPVNSSVRVMEARYHVTEEE
ncbi:DUF2169 family type VI secretion system accessory protein [Citrobacter portucalensis]|uniref:DUF2169 family type VI secretion system accessory protein n=1 Tax=Citrobacter portucalensis TaxID=1639133 RepID=UPI001F3AB753|nr:DUF2169 domain-containing protein [Citrobacter portucalensis]